MIHNPECPFGILSVRCSTYMSEKDPTSDFTYRLISVGDAQIGNLRDDDASRINQIADRETQRGDGNVASNVIRSVYFRISCSVVYKYF